MTTLLSRATLIAHDRPTRRPVALPVRRWLTTGVSYAIPFAVTGGSLIALAYLLGGPGVASGTSSLTLPGVATALTSDPGAVVAGLGYPALVYLVGIAALALLVPVLSGFIAYAIAGPVGLVAGLVGGALASMVGAGYLGGLVTGAAAGGLAWLLCRVPVNRAVRGLAQVVGIPVVSTLLTGLLVLTVIGPPLAGVQQRVTMLLTALSGTHAVLLGVALGLMVALDLGGPVNKAAYAFALAALAGGDGHVLAAVMAAGMAAPLSVALASTARPRLFSDAERGAGRAAWLLGGSFITEGAIPFAAADPLRVLPSLMAGSATASGISMAAAVSLPAPHGGLWVSGLADHPLSWLAATGVGTLVGASCLIVAKSPTAVRVNAAWRRNSERSAVEAV